MTYKISPGFPFPQRKNTLLSDELMDELSPELRRYAEASQKRSAAMKAYHARKKAERLARPPSSLDEAWKRHADACPHPRGTSEATAWYRDAKFDFDGTHWLRRVQYQTSNSGKTRFVNKITYHGDDGRTVVTKDDGLNRRNDPSRNWGLPD